MPELIKGDMIKEGTTVIDIGMRRGSERERKKEWARNSKIVTACTSTVNWVMLKGYGFCLG